VGKSVADTRFLCENYPCVGNGVVAQLVERLVRKESFSRYHYNDLRLFCVVARYAKLKGIVTRFPLISEPERAVLMVIVANKTPKRVKLVFR
jgi:hypothetical protein